MTTEKTIIDFLNKQPDFFKNNPDLLTKLTLPHLRGNASLSLLEQQTNQLRQALFDSQQKFNQLIRLSEFNYQEQIKVQKFILKLLKAENNAAIKALFVKDFAQKFFLNQVELILWQDVDKKKYQQVLRYVAEKKTFHGKLTAKESALLCQKPYGSLVLSHLINKKSLGLLVFCAADKRFLEDKISTLLLDFIADLTAIRIK